jgi:hypothetical protein
VQATPSVPDQRRLLFCGGTAAVVAAFAWTALCSPWATRASRLLPWATPTVAGSPEIERYLLLRERLREDEGDRELYARTKRELASRDLPNMQHLAEAKTDVIEGIIARAAAAQDP